MKNLYIRIAKKNNNVNKCLEKILKKLNIKEYNCDISTNQSETYIIKSPSSKPEIRLYLDEILTKRGIKYLTYSERESNIMHILSFEEHYKHLRNNDENSSLRYSKITVPKNIIRQFRLYLRQNHINSLNSIENTNNFYIAQKDIEKLKNWKEVWEEILENWNLKNKEEHLKIVSINSF